MNAIINFAEGFMGLFALGAETFIGWVTGIVPQVLLLLIAMNTIIRLLQLINENELKLKSYEDKFFSHYIFDFFINLYTKGDYEIKCAVASKINILIDLEMKFLYCSSISRYKRNVIQRNEEQSKTNENSENNEKQMQTMRFYFGFYFYFFADSRGAGGCRI